MEYYRYEALNYCASICKRAATCLLCPDPIVKGWTTSGRRAKCERLSRRTTNHHPTGSNALLTLSPSPSVETSHSPPSTPPFSVAHTTMTQVIGEVPHQKHTPVKLSRLYCIGSATWGSIPRGARKWIRKKKKKLCPDPRSLLESQNIGHE